MAKSDLSNIPGCVVIGGSAGSLKVILSLVTALDARLPFPVVIVLHRKNDASSLEHLLNDRCPLRVKEAEDKEDLAPGTVYLAPPDYHLLIESDHSLSLDASEKVLWSRPSIDVTFQSAAEAFGHHVLAILLSGANNDGASGLEYIRHHGGQIIVQDPDNAEIPVMPRAALARLRPDLLLPDYAMAAAINHFL
ncbi:chemotaxis protein CheB [Taibaiella koreensis]|uniref:chemotaxis protein CheB n=1 Tax=Taibaiella koreensis TaxID=1268548 RepID=UPI000E59A703|nr:chemotaxis protein CheB [Taibaiella koreensis]